MDRSATAPQLGDEAPDFVAETTEGTISFHEWLGDGWGVLFSHPKNFTPVCTTELGEVARIKSEFDPRGVKVIGFSVDPLEAHERWSVDILTTQGYAPNFPLIADPDADGEPQGLDAGQLEAGRRCDHRRRWSARRAEPRLRL